MFTWPVFGDVRLEFRLVVFRHPRWFCFRGISGHVFRHFLMFVWHFPAIYSCQCSAIYFHFFCHPFPSLDGTSFLVRGWTSPSQRFCISRLPARISCEIWSCSMSPYSGDIPLRFTPPSEVACCWLPFGNGLAMTSTSSTMAAHVCFPTRHGAANTSSQTTRFHNRARTHWSGKRTDLSSALHSNFHRPTSATQSAPLIFWTYLPFRAFTEQVTFCLKDLLIALY